MYALVTCTVCTHGATLHEAGGCTVPLCACAWTREQVIDETVELAKVDISNAWR